MTALMTALAAGAKSLVGELGTLQVVGLRFTLLEYTGVISDAALGWWCFGERLTVRNTAGTARVIADCLQAARRTSSAG